MTELARDYGEGLFLLAKEEGLIDPIMDDMNALSGLLRQEPDYVRLLDSHALPRDERLKLCEEAFGGQVHGYVLNFMRLLLERGAIREFNDCARHFRARCLEEKGIVEAKVVSACPLTDAQRRALRHRLNEISGKGVLLIERVDPSVVGGLRVDMLGRRYDNTISHRLAQLRRRLTGDE